MTSDVSVLLQMIMVRNRMMTCDLNYAEVADITMNSAKSRMHGDLPLKQQSSFQQFPFRSMYQRSISPYYGDSNI